MMNRCRICLESKRNLCSTFDNYQGLPYASMITLLTGIKIVKDENDMICLQCRRKLRDFYEFKLLIERSDLELSKKSKVFKFNTLDDIKVEFPDQLNRKELVNVAADYNNDLFQHDTDCIYYYNTLIRRLIKQENETVPTEEGLNTIKPEGFEENDYVDDYVQDTSADEEYNCKSRKKIKLKMSKKNKSSNKTKIPIKHTLTKPILINDLILIPSRNKIKKEKKKPKRKDTVCPFCAKVTSSKYIAKHILIHTAEKPFKCNKCSKSFRSNTYLKTHNIQSHSREGTYKCEHCIGTFSSKAAIKRHMLSHMKKQFSCGTCKKEFNRKHALQQHELRLHGGSKTIQCDKCNMSFYNKFNLKTHYRVHTGERPYKCELCSQPYSYKRDFNRHCLKKHGVIVDSRPVHVMNEEVLRSEKALMKDLMLSLHGLPTDSEPKDSFHGPQKAIAFAKAVKLMQNGQVPIDVHF